MSTVSSCRALLVVPWGTNGAMASVPLSSGRVTVQVPVHAPSTGAVVDTLGAGDTFLAGLISSIYSSDPLTELLRGGGPSPSDVGLLASTRHAISFATVVAGEKVGVQGFDLSSRADVLLRYLSTVE